MRCREGLGVPRATPPRPPCTVLRPSPRECVTCKSAVITSLLVRNNKRRSPHRCIHLKRRVYSARGKVGQRESRCLGHAKHLVDNPAVAALTAASLLLRPRLGTVGACVAAHWCVGGGSCRPRGGEAAPRRGTPRFRTWTHVAAPKAQRWHSPGGWVGSHLRDTSRTSHGHATCPGHRRGG